MGELLPYDSHVEPMNKRRQAMCWYPTDQAQILNRKLQDGFDNSESEKWWWVDFDFNWVIKTTADCEIGFVRSVKTLVSIIGRGFCTAHGCYLRLFSTSAWQNHRRICIKSPNGRLRTECTNLRIVAASWYLVLAVRDVCTRRYMKYFAWQGKKIWSVCWGRPINLK